MVKLSLLASCALSIATSAIATPLTASNGGVISFRGPFSVTYDSVHNIHVDFVDGFEGHIKIVHGACEIVTASDCHHEIGNIYVKRQNQPERLVWVIPENALHEGCLHAYSDNVLIGRSAPISIAHPHQKRQLISEVADVTGPWFDGVAALADSNQTEVYVSEAKNKSIAIVGGGAAGILTALLLDSVGVHNWHMIESSSRIGGRIRTKYLAGTTPEEYQYQEMGPMRFPVAVTYADTNETLEIQDHKMVFQLGDYLNQLNNNDSDLAVNFIPWIQRSPNVPGDSNGYRKPDGTIPSVSEIAVNPELIPPIQNISTMDAVAEGEAAVAEFMDLTPERMRNISANIFAAHKDAIERGLFYWSETAYLKYELGLDANSVDYAAGVEPAPMWNLLYESVYFSSTSWATIDKGLEQIPRAALPHIQDRLTLNRTIEELSYDENSDKISVHWRPDLYSLSTESEEYDYAVVTAPFTRVRTWRMPEYSSLLTRAIETMPYQGSCKVALHFKTRFWEHLDPPIIGGCGWTDIFGLGSPCYPSYAINSTGPGVVLATYATGAAARSFAAMTEEQHVALAYRAMVEMHGEEIISEQYTGHYDRQCWETDEHTVGCWAQPNVGQQEIYLPAYYNTEFKTIFMGEHTAMTHAWIFSALESATRGTTQLLLDLGLVDEAKEVVEQWMGRWIRL